MQATLSQGNYQTLKHLHKHAASEVLLDTFGRRATAAGKQSALERSPRLHWRSDIVSTKLCDDVLRYISPTLEAYKGTTIIDVNPGACIWSAKIHEFLKPKRHLLMEPEKKYYKPFIEPLLQQPDSKYRYTTLAGAHAKSYWTNYSKVLGNPDLIPPRRQLNFDDPRMREIDTSLLVIGNLWRRDSHHIGKDVDVVTMIMQHMTFAGISNDLFHSSGLVRMLWWMPELAVLDVMSNNVLNNRALEAGIDLGAEVVQVAGTKSHDQLTHEGRYFSTRPSGLQVAASAHVAKATRRLKAETGVQRLDLGSIGAGSEHMEDRNPLETSCTTLDKLRQEIDDVTKRLRSMNTTQHVVLSEETVKQWTRALVYPQSLTVVKGATWIKRLFDSDARIIAIARAVDMSMQVLHLEAELAAWSEKHPDDAALPELTELVLGVGQLLDERLATMTQQQNMLIDRTVDDMRAAYALTPYTPRDGRPFEPLKAEQEETWPPHDMALLMVTPRTDDLSIPGVMSRKEAASTCQELLKHMYFYRASPVPMVLERLAYGAAEALIPNVPAMKDVRHGGRLDPMKVKVRDLSHVMLRQLIMAFGDWPFKPSNLQMEISSSSEQVEELQEAEDE